MEIFDKAIHLARIALERGQPEVLDRAPPSNRPGDWRLHMQAVKVMIKAVENVAREGGTVNAANVVAEIKSLRTQHGTGWERVTEKGKNWYYKDFENGDDIIATLGFISALDVHFDRYDNNDIKQSRHLRMPENDYHRIFNPKMHFALENQLTG